MSDDRLGSQAPSAGPIPNSKLAMIRIGAQYAVESRLTGKFYPLQYGLGSGEQGMTYVSVLDSATLFEMHYSYFPEAKKWFITPGHEQNKLDPKSLGIGLSGEIPRKCILCHAVTLPEANLLVEPQFLGVGCESCHGPGGAHVEAAQSRRATDLHMEDLSKLGGFRMNILCGRCHRKPEEVKKLPQSQRLSQRFFPYGLSMSRCFQASGDTLTCSGCHDPHTNVIQDHKAFESRCLQCHSAAPRALGIAQAKSPFRIPENPVVCSVNARNGCIPCHMPKRNAFPGTSLPIQMADHWIRIHRQ